MCPRLCQTPICITSIFLDHISCRSTSPLPSLFSFHLLLSFNVNYISLCEATPSISCLDCQAQVNWLTTLIQSSPPPTILWLMTGVWWTGRRGARGQARGCQEGSKDGGFGNTPFSLAYIISFSGTGMAICMHVKRHLQASARPSFLAYRKRYPMKRIIELGNTGTVICGKWVLWPGEKYSLEHTSSCGESKREEASALFI